MVSFLSPGAVTWLDTIGLREEASVDLLIRFSRMLSGDFAHVAAHPRR